MEFPGRDWLFMGVVALLAVPIQMSLIPLLQLYVGGAHLTIFGETLTVFPDLDLAGTTDGGLAHAYRVRVAAGDLPPAQLHGRPAAGRLRGGAGRRRRPPADLLAAGPPLSLPALAAFAIFQFLWVWNDYLVALTFVGNVPDKAPLTVRLASLAGSRGQDWHLLTAAAFISIALPLAVFFALQRYFVRGLLAGSVKG